MRIGSSLSRLPIAAWLGLAGMGLQAALPLFLAFAVVAHGHAGGIDVSHGSAIHPLHADHAPGTPLSPAHDPAHRHAHCILCQGLQAAAPATLPSALALAAPLGDVAAPAAAAQPALRVFGSPAAYISRAPPSIG